MGGREKRAACLGTAPEQSRLPRHSRVAGRSRENPAGLRLDTLNDAKDGACAKFTYTLYSHSCVSESSTGTE